MMPLTPASRRRPIPARSRDAAGHEQVDVVVRTRPPQQARRPAPSRRGRGRIAGRRGRSARRPGSSRVGHARPAPGKRREPLGPRIEAHRQPVAGDGDRIAQELGLLDDAHRQHDPGRARPRTPAGSGRRPRRRRPAGAASATRDATRPTASRLTGWPLRAPSKSTRWIERRALLDEVGGDPLGPVGRRADAGRGARPEDDARPTAFEVDRWDDLHAVAARLRPVPGRLHRRTVGDGS